jgi:hypothetical protein
MDKFGRRLPLTVLKHTLDIYVKRQENHCKPVE